MTSGAITDTLVDSWSPNCRLFPACFYGGEKKKNRKKRKLKEKVAPRFSRGFSFASVLIKGILASVFSQSSCEDLF